MKEYFKMFAVLAGAMILGLAGYAAFGVLYDLHQVVNQQCQQIEEQVIKQIQEEAVAEARAEWEAVLEEEKDGEDTP